MTLLVTGAAGFIGYHVSRKLAERGERVIGVDSLTDTYGADLKRRRLVQLSTFPSFRFEKIDLNDRDALVEAIRGEPVRTVIHLAGQSNVRQGLEQPHAYIDSNVRGHLNVLEHGRHAGALQTLIYASSSSVYGDRNAPPFREDGITDHPTSLYGATKKTQEMMSEIYAEIFRVPQIGLRLFSVYGPWGRPDTACWQFTESILRRRPIRVFDNGEMDRDFIYIDDAVNGILAIADATVAPDTPLHRIYNVGTGRTVGILEVVGILEGILGRRAEVEMHPRQPGEMLVTAADLTAIREDFSFRPRIALEEGLRRFVEWYKRHHQVK